MEPFLIDIHPALAQKRARRPPTRGRSSSTSSPGRWRSYGKDMYRLKAGDSIYYDSIVPHHVHSAGRAEARVLAVVYAP